MSRNHLEWNEPNIEPLPADYKRFRLMVTETDPRTEAQISEARPATRADVAKALGVPVSQLDLFLTQMDGVN